MPNPMMQMLMGGGSRRPNNPLAMMAEFRKFAAGMTPQKAQQEIEQLLELPDDTTKGFWRQGKCRRSSFSSSNSRQRTLCNF